MLTGNRASIAIIDTGVDLSHPDLRFNRWINEKEVSGNQKDDDGNGYVDDYYGFNFSADSSEVGPQGDWADNRHGTHVAGLAGSRVDNGVGGSGIAGTARLMSLNVFGVNNYTRSSILENALRYAADIKVDIINLSLGGREYSRTMRAALEYAVGRGSFIVSAAGNDGMEICDNPTSYEFISPAVYGSSIDGMIVTGSVDVMNGAWSRFSNYSQRLVEISAPGAYDSEGLMIGLLSTVPTDRYEKIAGTSMSAPVVSGAAALAVTWLRTYRYPVSPARLEAILKGSARSEVPLTTQVQYGRVLDLRSLAEYLKTNYPPRSRAPNLSAVPIAAGRSAN
jgi:subtilisin family serine protease